MRAEWEQLRCEPCRQTVCKEGPKSAEHQFGIQGGFRTILRLDELVSRFTKQKSQAFGPSFTVKSTLRAESISTSHFPHRSSFVWAMSISPSIKSHAASHGSGTTSRQFAINSHSITIALHIACAALPSIDRHLPRASLACDFTRQFPLAHHDILILSVQYG